MFGLRWCRSHLDRAEHRSYSPQGLTHPAITSFLQLVSIYLTIGGMSDDPTRNLEQRYDTRPILENLLSEMRGGFEAVNLRLDRIDARLDDLSAKVKVLNEDVLQVRSDLSRIGKRVESLEAHFKEPA